MKKYFNIAGPCNPEEHYIIPSESRCKGIISLIEQEQYFVIHAPRQSGKTTLLFDLAKKLNHSGNYHTLYCTLESLQGIDDPKEGIPGIIKELGNEISSHNDLKGLNFESDIDADDYISGLRMTLTRFCESLKKPLVILFDEVDCLSNGTLISFLRQLRAGYVNRIRIPFVHSVGLIGMRNIRDYKARIRGERETLGSASPFNIVTEVFTLNNFTQEELVQLYSEHTKDTGQLFSPEVIRTIYDYTQGQPWLVNAVAREIIEKILESDYSKTITVEHVEQAAENIIKRRDTHIDSLLERLKEERVRKVVEPVLTGEEKGFDFTDDDYQYALDLGLIKNIKDVLSPSNPIYAEVIIRKLSSESQMSMNSACFPPEAPAYLEKGELNMKKLLTDFQEFWRENSAIWEERFQYKEAAPHLILLAFLQRIVNSGGKISREFATGRKRLDLCVHYQNNRYPVEIKIRYDTKTYEEGMLQLSAYLDSLGCEEGWLVVFDKRKRQSWKKKLFWKTQKKDRKTIHLIGC